MKVVIQKPDLDTCLTGLICGVSKHDHIHIVLDSAGNDDLKNPSVLCIECGGTGLMDLNNFDHHDPERYFPPACKQVYDHLKCKDVRLKRLVKYVCLIDDRSEKHPHIPFPSLSNIFSGMLLVEKDLKKQFLKGIEIFKKVLEDDIDPFSTMPRLFEWAEFIEAKIENMVEIERASKDAQFFYSERGEKIGFLESTSIGGIGALYKAGCDVAIIYNPAFGDPPRPKYTIAGNNKKLVQLLPFFDNMEKGWGGREKIIGSPKAGSRLKPEEILEIVLKNL